MKDSVWRFIILLCSFHAHIIAGLIQSSPVIWVEKGNDTILYCNLGGTEESFDWTRGQNYTASTQNLLAYNNGGVKRGQCLTQGKCELLGRDLKLKKVQISDEDTYYCGTPKSYTSVKLNVTIEPSVPTINHCSDNKCAIVYPVGLSLYLTCVIRGSRPAANLAWSNSTHKVTNFTKTSVHINQNGTFDTISFLHVRHHAPTVYTCEAHGPSIRHSWKSRATINVTEAINPDKIDKLLPVSKHPEIDYCGLQQNCSLTWPIGIPLQLRCTLRVVQYPLKLYWWHTQYDLSKNMTTEVHPGPNGALTYVAIVTLHVNRSSVYYCFVGEDANLFEDHKPSIIYITSTDVFSLNSNNENINKDGWRISTIILGSSVLLLFLLLILLILYIFLKPKICCQRVATDEAKGYPLGHQENNGRKVGNELQDPCRETDPMMEQDKPILQEAIQEGSLAADEHEENHPFVSREPVSKDSDEVDLGQTPERVKESSAVHQPTDNGTPESSNGQMSQTRDTGGGGVGTQHRISSPATYPVTEGENSADYSSESTSSTTFDETTVEKLSSPKVKRHLITPKLIRDKVCSCNFSLEDEESDIFLAFTMKGYGLIISFVPYLGQQCDVGYMIHFKENGEIIFRKHGMDIDLSGDENRYDPSKKYNFILNTASKTVLLIQEENGSKKPLLQYTPVQTDLCSYLVIDAHQHSHFDMVLFPAR